MKLGLRLMLKHLFQGTSSKSQLVTASLPILEL